MKWPAWWRAVWFVIVLVVGLPVLLAGAVLVWLLSLVLIVFGEVTVTETWPGKPPSHV